MYQRNLLAKPNGLKIGNVPIDLRKVKIPIYIQAAKEDHIAPWHSTYKMVKHFSGPITFMLAGSGHIAGVINPPAAKRYQHWLNDAKTYPDKPDDWFKGAKEHPGSWWPHWDKWLSAKSGPKVAPRNPAKGKLKPLADAPGTYVKVQLTRGAKAKA
jgi:polyhydroxyalkanoate synthase